MQKKSLKRGLGMSDIVELNLEDFESMAICAERYACGRRTYMPSVVISITRPLIPRLTDNTLQVLQNDISAAKNIDALGDKNIDAPLWVKFLAEIRAELRRRGNNVGV